MESLLPILMNGVGGAVLGPIVSKVLGGSGSSGLIGGLLGGVVGGYGMDAAGLQLLGGSDIMNIIGNLLQGGIGGGVLGAIAGMLMRSRN